MDSHDGYLKTTLPDANGDPIGIGDEVDVPCRVTAVRTHPTADHDNDTALVTLIAIDEPHGTPFALRSRQVTKRRPPDRAA